MLTDIVDKVVWVTGASSGIGAAAAIALSQAGAKVILSGRREEKLHAIAADLEHETFVAPLDVSIAEDVTQVVGKIMARYGYFFSLESQQTSKICDATKPGGATINLTTLHSGLSSTCFLGNQCAFCIFQRLAEYPYVVPDQSSRLPVLV